MRNIVQNKDRESSSLFSPFSILHSPSSIPPRRSAFTLVEMLVSTVLVVMIMLMFATVFQLAAGAMQKQKGMAENDQRARTLTTLIHTDLQNRTFENITPYFPNEQPPPTGSISFTNRLGYFYYSENDVTNPTDDVLQFTVTVPDDSPLYGRAALLGANTDLNQPEGDDGAINANALVDNNTGASRSAEVSYFLRNGNLYRRVLLIRTPYVDDPGERPAVSPFVPGNYTSGSAVFWRDFDYSAFFNTFAGTPTTQLNDTDSLNNATNAGTFPIAIPSTRFGHFNGNQPNPREFDDNGGFFGRFTKQETSHSAFAYPAMDSNNPFDTDAMPAVVVNANGMVNGFSDELDGRGADILLSNVHAFDVKILDAAYDEDINANSVLDPGEDQNGNSLLDRTGGFANLGHAAPGGDYRKANDRHANPNALHTYGPTTQANNRVFDTWHPDIDLDNISAPLARAQPPYRAARSGPDGAPGVAGVDDDGLGGTDDQYELGWPGSDDVVLPLNAIQITVRFFDVSSDQMRQLTIVQSLVPAATP